jgi:hypothetical protein
LLFPAETAFLSDGLPNARRYFIVRVGIFSLLERKVTKKFVRTDMQTPILARDGSIFISVEDPV